MRDAFPLPVIIPVFNERPALRKLIEHVRAVPLDKEILVIDDASTDGTPDTPRAIASDRGDDPGNRSRVFFQERNAGKGAAGALSRMGRLMRRFWQPAGLVAILFCVACESTSYEVARPWQDSTQITQKAVTRAGATRPARRVRVRPGVDTVLSLGRVLPGALVTALTAAGALKESGTLELEMDGAGTPEARRKKCSVPLRRSERPGLWRPCRIPVPVAAGAAALRLRWSGAAPADVFVASPILTSRQRAHRPLVFVLLTDTVRADRLRAFGSGLPLGAALQRLAKDGIVFAKMWSASAWTRPAVATLLTGLAPAGHQVLDRSDVLASGLPFLPQILQKHGYRTVAWSANPNIFPIWGFDRGFDLFVDAGAQHWVKDKTDGAALFRSLEKALLLNGRWPFFYYVHFMDAHGPYRPDAAHLARIRATAELMASFPGEGHAGGLRADKARAQYPLYLAEILDLDEQLGRFLDFLHRQKLYDNSLILVVSDHGEEFLDHGRMYHGKTLYEEMLHVPVVLKLPHDVAAGTRVKEAVEFVDLLPTLLSVLRVPVPAGLDGRSLFAGERVVPPPTHARTAGLRLDGKSLSAVNDGPWKLIVDHRGGGEELFNLRRDPGERQDVAARYPEQVDRLRLILDRVASGRRHGWHLLGCAGDDENSLSFSLTGTGLRPETALFEDDDRMTVAESGELSVTMHLGERAVVREIGGRLLPASLPDEDALLLRPRGESGVTIALRSLSVVRLLYSLGLNGRLQSAASFSVDRRTQGVRVRASEPVGCSRPEGDDGETARPYLRIWFVPAPRHLPKGALDPSVEERLHALGYR